MLKQLQAFVMPKEAAPIDRLSQNWQAFLDYHEMVNASKENYVPAEPRPTSSLSNLVKSNPQRIKQANKRSFTIFATETREEELARKNTKLLRAKELNGTLEEIGKPFSNRQAKFSAKRSRKRRK